MLGFGTECLYLSVCLSASLHAFESVWHLFCFDLLLSLFCCVQLGCSDFLYVPAVPQKYDLNDDQ